MPRYTLALREAIAAEDNLHAMTRRIRRYATQEALAVGSVCDDMRSLARCLRRALQVHLAAKSPEKPPKNVKAIGRFPSPKHLKAAMLAAARAQVGRLERLEAIAPDTDSLFVAILSRTVRDHLAYLTEPAKARKLSRDLFEIRTTERGIPA